MAREVRRRSNSIESFLLGVACSGLALFTVIAASHFIIPIITLDEYRGDLNQHTPYPTFSIETPEPTQYYKVQYTPTPYTTQPTATIRPTPPIPEVTSNQVKINIDDVDLEKLNSVQLPSKVIYNGGINKTNTETISSYDASKKTNYETYPKVIRFNYISDYTTKYFSMVTYEGVYNYLSDKDRQIYAGSEAEGYRKFIDDPIQDIYMDDLIEYIKSTSTSTDEQAINAIRLVQNIPYDTDTVEKRYEVRYPYQVIYENEGVCSEKSLLLIYILKELGYSTAYLQFNDENHAVVGVKCDHRYEYKGTGYCFVESTTPIMMTYSYMDYGYVGELDSMPYVIHMSDGRSLKLIEDEWRDSARFKELSDKAVEKNGTLPPDEYNTWFDILKRYGIKVGN